MSTFLTQAGFDFSSKAMRIHSIGRAMERGEARLIGKRVSTVGGHVVIPQKIQTWRIKNRIVTKTWVMDPAKGVSFRAKPFWLVYDSFLLKKP